MKIQKWHSELAKKFVVILQQATKTLPRKVHYLLVNGKVVSGVIVFAILYTIKKKMSGNLGNLKNIKVKKVLLKLTFYRVTKEMWTNYS